MKIIVIGAGTLGSAICTQLVGEGHDLTVVDKDAHLVSELSNLNDLVAIVGNGAEVDVLRRAGVERANLVIAATAGDELNILICAAAKRLGARHTIARVRNPEYTELMHLLHGEMSLSLVINPELAAAKEIYRMLRFPAAAKIDLCCRGRVELAEFPLVEGSPLAGLTLNELRSRINIGFLVCAVQRDGQTHIPGGDFRLEAGDLICVTAPEHDIPPFFKAIGMHRTPVKNVLITGGSRVTYYLESLLASGHISSTVIEKDKERCRELAEAFRCTVVCDDGTKQETLDGEGIRHADAFLALSETDEENAIVSLYAKTVGVPKIVTMISKLPYIDFFKTAGLESIVSPKSSSAAQVLRYVRALAHAQDSEIETLHKLMDGTVEALEFVIKEDVEGLTDIPLREVRARRGVLIACIVHEGAVVIPSGGDAVRRGDTVVVITTGEHLDSIGDILK